MKTLDKYILGTFLYSLAMWLIVIMVLRVVLDVLLTMDEFTENIDYAPGQGIVIWEIIKFIFKYYYYHCFVYFAQFGGIVIVAATGFTIWQLSRTNELTAMLAAGVSLYRVAFPILFCAVFMCILVAVDREWAIPGIRSNLTRDPDEMSAKDYVEVNYVNDENNTVWYSRAFDPDNEKIQELVVEFRRGENFDYVCTVGAVTASPGTLDGRNAWVGRESYVLGRNWQRPWKTTEIPTNLVTPRFILEKVVGEPGMEYSEPGYPGFKIKIWAEKVIPERNDQGDITGARLTGPRFDLLVGDRRQIMVSVIASEATWDPGDRKKKNSRWKLKNGRVFIPSGMSPSELELRASGEYIQYCSSRELTKIHKHSASPDTVLFNKFRRIAEPFNNLIMLLIALPFLLSRERHILLSIGTVLLLVILFFAFVYIVPYLPIGSFLSAFLPALIVGPVAVLLLDSVKT